MTDLTGWVLVPRVATEAMLAAMGDAPGISYRAEYAAAIAASPSPPVDVAGLVGERDSYKAAWEEYNDKTEWVQASAKPKELGYHRADVLRQRLEAAEAECARLRAENEELHEGIRQTAEGLRRGPMSDDARESMAAALDVYAALTHQDPTK